MAWPRAAIFRPSSGRRSCSGDGAPSCCGGRWLATALACATALALAWHAVPWYATVIGGGAALLFAPLLLQPLPDTFVNGRRGLLVFCAGAALLAGSMWVWA